MTETKPGYHIRHIQKGKYGEFSKIAEEFYELEDAYDQGSKVLEIVELCDLLGAIRGYAEKSLGIGFEELLLFSKITDRAFINGHRQVKES